MATLAFLDQNGLEVLTNFDKVVKNMFLSKPFLISDINMIKANPSALTFGCVISLCNE
jgi:hypothetical protein